MNQHHPQQPYSQQPPQGPYGQQPHQPYPPQQQAWGMPPQAPRPPKKTSAGKLVAIGCAGMVGLLVVIGIIGAALGGGNDSSGTPDDSSAVKPAATATKDSKPGAGKDPKADAPKGSGKKKPAPKAADPKPKAKTVTFKVWGNAPTGALGPLDITYGSDSDSRDGNFKNGTFTATLPLDDDAMYYDISAQLQGSGDIQCSVTVDGKTKKAHAAGSYNLCTAQLSGGLFGGWS